MVTLFIDGGRENTVVNVLDVAEGKHVRTCRYIGTVSEQAEAVVDLIHMFKKVDKMIFDKNGFGLSVYESAVKELSRKGYSLNNKSELVYPKADKFKVGDKVIAHKDFMHHYGLGRGVMKFSDEGDIGVIVEMWREELNDQDMLSVTLPTLQLVVPMSTFKEVFRKVDK